MGCRLLPSCWLAGDGVRTPHRAIVASPCLPRARDTKLQADTALPGTQVLHPVCTCARDEAEPVLGRPLRRARRGPRVGSDGGASQRGQLQPDDLFTTTCTPRGRFRGEKVNEIRPTFKTTCMGEECVEVGPAYGGRARWTVRGHPRVAVAVVVASRGPPIRARLVPAGPARARKSPPTNRPPPPNTLQPAPPHPAPNPHPFPLPSPLTARCRPSSRAARSTPPPPSGPSPRAPRPRAASTWPPPARTTPTPTARRPGPTLRPCPSGRSAPGSSREACLRARASTVSLGGLCWDGVSGGRAGWVGRGGLSLGRAWQGCRIGNLGRGQPGPVEVGMVLKITTG